MLKDYDGEIDTLLVFVSSPLKLMYFCSVDTSQGWSFLGRYDSLHRRRL